MRCLDIFQEIVQIDSVTGNESAMANYILTFLQACNIDAQKDSVGNVSFHTEGEGEPRFFCAHMDTVEPGNGIVPIIKNGYVESKGETILGADNKVAVASILWAVFHRDNFRPLDVVFTTSEESGNYGAIGFDMSTVRSKIGYAFDLEGEIGTIITASPFYARFDLTMKGIPVHAAYREDGVEVLNPSLKTMTTIESLRNADLLVNIGIISGGTARNTVMGDITISGEIRSFKEDAFQLGVKQLEAIVFPANIDAKMDVVVENGGYEHKTEDLDRVIAELSRASGVQAKTKSSFGCSDANIFNTGKISVFNMSDGSEFPHTTRERVSVKNLELLGKVVYNLMQNKKEREI